MEALKRNAPLITCTAAIVLTMIVCTWKVIDALESSLISIDVNTEQLVEQGRYR
jgi:hypothetical protein